MTDKNETKEETKENNVEAADNQQKSILSEEFAQALMSDIVFSGANGGEDMTGELIRVVVVIEVLDNGKSLKIIHQAIDAVNKVEPEDSPEKESEG